MVWYGKLRTNYEKARKYTFKETNRWFELPSSNLK